MGNRCMNCAHFFVDGEGWELPQFDYPNCLKRPDMANLKSFPFERTKCPSFTPKEPKA